MNKEVSIIIEDIINQDFDLVKAKILDINFYEKWWKNFRTKVNNKLGIIVFQPIRHLKIKLQVTQITENTIAFIYADGLIEGVGCWEIQNLGANITRLSYSVSLFSKWKFIHFLIGSTLFKWKHSKDIKSLINNI